MEWQSNILTLANVSLTDANEGNRLEDKQKALSQCVLIGDAWHGWAPPLSPGNWFSPSSTPWITF